MLGGGERILAWCRDVFINKEMYMDLSFISAWLDDLLDPKSFNDYCVNGLCVEASDKVSKIVTGVSLRDQLIDAAIAEKADCIIVHHPNGFWKGERQLPVGKFGERIRKLMVHGISVFGFHLPLDGHREIGNNAVIAKNLGLNPVHEFAYEGMRPIGVIAEWNTPATREEFLDCLDAAFEHGVQNKFFYGSEQIKRVAICSGSCSASAVREAMEKNCDAYVTGSVKEEIPIFCQENGVNLVSCGHHRSEIFGVSALAEKIQTELSIPTKFVDCDNPV